MTVYEEIKAERSYQDSRWGTAFDDKNTANDWVAYISMYAAKASPEKWDAAEFRKGMIKVATLAVAAIETFDRNGKLPPRHYDLPEGKP